MKYVQVPYGKRKELAQKFDCSQSTVALALRFKIDSEIARRIRSAALNEFSGFEVEF